MSPGPGRPGGCSHGRPALRVEGVPIALGARAPRSRRRSLSPRSPPESRGSCSRRSARRGRGRTCRSGWRRASSARSSAMSSAPWAPATCWSCSSCWTPPHTGAPGAWSTQSSGARRTPRLSQAWATAWRAEPGCGWRWRQASRAARRTVARRPRRPTWTPGFGASSFSTSALWRCSGSGRGWPISRTPGRWRASATAGRASSRRSTRHWVGVCRAWTC
mmetsp:Transcript_24220/g.76803  ORF Transcript_24220/g.76803 Transcript_24220/m.76803 type:complete len:219 (+) Transcript_24220:271-927(+)